MQKYVASTYANQSQNTAWINAGSGVVTISEEQSTFNTEVIGAKGMFFFIES